MFTASLIVTKLAVTTKSFSAILTKSKSVAFSLLFSIVSYNVHRIPHSYKARRYNKKFFGHFDQKQKCSVFTFVQYSFLQCSPHPSLLQSSPLQQSMHVVIVSSRRLPFGIELQR